MATKALLAGTRSEKLKQSVFVGQAGELGFGVAVVSTTGGCEEVANTGMVTCKIAPPVGAASCKAETVTAPAVGVEESTAVVIWPVSVAGGDGAVPSGARGILPKLAPMGMLNAIVGL